MRKKGDWEKIVKEREHKPRFIPTTRGQSNIPPVTQTGSAAYRRRNTKHMQRSIDSMR
jgi:hypothetical protein